MTIVAIKTQLDDDRLERGNNDFYALCYLGIFPERPSVSDVEVKTTA